MSNLRLINETEITSSQSSTTVNNIFSSDYDIYKIVVNDFSQAGATITSPSVGNAQLISAKITTPTLTGTTFDFTMPTSRTNGAGVNGSLYNQNPPIIQAWALSNGNQNTSAVISLNTSTNFNQFEVGGLASLVKSLIRVTF